MTLHLEQGQVPLVEQHAQKSSEDALGAEQCAHVERALHLVLCLPVHLLNSIVSMPADLLANGEAQTGVAE